MDAVSDVGLGFCDDCGAPAIGVYEFFYPNPEVDKSTIPGAGAKWSSPRRVCLVHKKAREAAGHRSRLPSPEVGGNAPDPAQGTQAPDFDKNPSGKGAKAPPTA